MYSFIVLGQVPGTNIRVTFEAWLQVAVLLFIAAAAIRIYQEFYQEFRPLISELAPIRVPLHATQLHQRVR